MLKSLKNMTRRIDIIYIIRCDFWNSLKSLTFSVPLVSKAKFKKFLQKLAAKFNVNIVLGAF